MSRRRQVILDRELDARVMAYASENGLTASQAIRDLLRQIVMQADPPTRGWYEGLTLGQAQALKAQGQAIDQIRKAG